MNSNPNLIFTSKEREFVERWQKSKNAVFVEKADAFINAKIYSADFDTHTELCFYRFSEPSPNIIFRSSTNFEFLNYRIEQRGISIEAMPQIHLTKKFIKFVISRNKKQIRNVSISDVSSNLIF